jgi:tRNA-specific 2-thiouridylase
VVGKHTGIHNYTIGQRKGLGALGAKMFVKEIRVHDNTIIVAHDHELGASHIEISSLAVGPTPLKIHEEYLVQVRYRSQPTLATLTALTNSTATLDFLEPVRAVAPGQSAVLYSQNMVIGGGIINGVW